MKSSKMRQKFLAATEMIDFQHMAIQNKAQQLFTAALNDVDKTRVAYAFVRDEIPHSFDCNAQIIVSDSKDGVVKNQSNYCKLTSKEKREVKTQWMNQKGSSG